VDIRLTDALSCPQCGPAFGLILLADDMRERRVYEGRLGCPNCRQNYSIQTGVADLAPIKQTATLSASPDPELLTALLGVAEGPARLLLLDGTADLAAAIADGLSDVEVVVTSRVALPAAERAGVSRVLVSATLPFADRSMAGVALAANAGETGIQEAARVCALRGHLVAWQPTAATRAALESAGLVVLAENTAAVVAQRRQM
jgi:uncharacterized protein YbaR (Trm112 family)